MATTVRGRWYRRTRLLTQSRSHVKLYHNKRRRLCDDWDDTKSASLASSPVHVTLSTTQYSVLLGQLSLLHETWDLIISALTDRAFSFHQGSQSSLLTTKYHRGLPETHSLSGSVYVHLFRSPVRFCSLHSVVCTLQDALHKE
jgi:hypothetical protein